MLAGADVQDARRAAPAAFKETPATDAKDEAGTWKTAQPADDAHARRMVDDLRRRTLNDLEQQAADGEPESEGGGGAREASARIKQSARAALFPTVDAGFGPTREQPVAGVAVPAAGCERADANVVACAGERVV